MANILFYCSQQQTNANAQNQSLLDLSSFILDNFKLHWLVVNSLTQINFNYYNYRNFLFSQYEIIKNIFLEDFNYFLSKDKYSKFNFKKHNIFLNFYFNGLIEQFEKYVRYYINYNLNHLRIFLSNIIEQDINNCFTINLYNIHKLSKFFNNIKINNYINTDVQNIDKLRYIINQTDILSCLLYKLRDYINENSLDKKMYCPIIIDILHNNNTCSDFRFSQTKKSCYEQFLGKIITLEEKNTPKIYTNSIESEELKERIKKKINKLLLLNQEVLSEYYCEKNNLCKHAIQNEVFTINYYYTLDILNNLNQYLKIQENHLFMCTNFKTILINYFNSTKNLQSKKLYLIKLKEIHIKELIIREKMQNADIEKLVVNKASNREHKDLISKERKYFKRRKVITKKIKNNFSDLLLLEECIFNNFSFIKSLDIFINNVNYFENFNMFHLDSCIAQINIKLFYLNKYFANIIGLNNTFKSFTKKFISIQNILLNNNLDNKQILYLEIENIKKKKNNSSNNIFSQDLKSRTMSTDISDNEENKIFEIDQKIISFEKELNFLKDEQHSLNKLILIIGTEEIKNIQLLQLQIVRQKIFYYKEEIKINEIEKFLYNEKGNSLEELKGLLTIKKQTILMIKQFLNKIDHDYKHTLYKNKLQVCEIVKQIDNFIKSSRLDEINSNLDINEFVKFKK